MSTDASKAPLVLRYVYAILAILAIAFAAILISLFAAQQDELEARDKIQFLHLSAVAESAELAREVRTLRQRVLAQLDSKETRRPGIAGIQDAQIGFGGILQTMRARVQQLSDLQNDSDDKIFALTLKRLNDGFSRVERRLRFFEPTAETITSIDVLGYTVEQYQRLHQIAADRKLLELAEWQRQRPRFLGFIVLCLGLVAIAAWFLVHSLKNALRRQETAELELVQSQERMHHLQKLNALGRLVGGIAHDFNNWLTVILGHTGLLHDKAGDDKRLKSGLDEIQQASLQAASLTQQLLAFSRRQPFKPRIVDLNALIQGMEEVLRRVISADIELSFNYADGPCKVEVDPDQVQQVILNLLNNARDAMPDGGLLSITTERILHGPAGLELNGVPTGEYVRLSISDTGIGMDAETRQRIFEPFFTTKTREQGTGLGLSTVHGIITGSNGHILVESEEGEGSTFTIYLPSAEHRRATASETSRMGEKPSVGIETVLVVEDNEQVREFVRTGLKNLGYHVLSATGGADGLELCRDEKIGIDIIVSDVVMSETSGPSFMAAALKLRPNAVPIYMSAYTRGEVLQFRRGDATADIPLIAKPFKIEALAKVIREQLDNRLNA